MRYDPGVKQKGVLYKQKILKKFIFFVMEIQKNVIKPQNEGKSQVLL